MALRYNGKIKHSLRKRSASGGNSENSTKKNQTLLVRRKCELYRNVF